MEGIVGNRLRVIVVRLCLFLAVVAGTGLVTVLSPGMAHAATGTDVGGILSSNTEWTTAGSPYVVTSQVQIPAGVTLTIDPGVTVEGGNFLLNGTISAIGTASDPIDIDAEGQNLIDPQDSTTASIATLQYVDLSDGLAIWPNTGYSQNGSLQLLDSVVTGMTAYSYIWYSTDTVIEGNVFYDDAGFSIGGASGTTSGAVVDYNRFEGASDSGYWVESWLGLTDVNYNSFDPVGIAVELEPGYPGAAIDATNNDWGTSDSSTIESMIYDNHVNITCAGAIPYTPILSGPDASTPTGEFFSTTAPSVSGTTAVGETLTASSGNWGPADGATVAYQWAEDGTPISGATSPALALTPSDIGDEFTVAVTVSRVNFTTATFTSAATKAVTPGVLTSTKTPSVSGTARVGSTVTASPGSWTPSGTTYAYQWLANGAKIAGATSQSLLIPGSVADDKLSVKVTASKTGYANAAATSAADTVALGTIASTGVPTVSGTPRVGSTVTASPGDWTPSGATYTYQWLANGDKITGATHATYAIGAGLIGKELSVEVTAKDLGYRAVTVASSARVVARGVLVAKVKPKLTGTADVGKTLDVTTGTWNPDPVIKVQWYANGKAIAHATGLTLKLTAVLKGTSISVVVTAIQTGYTPATIDLKEPATVR
jgi:hypothetical protein